MKKRKTKVILLVSICLVILVGGLIADHYLGKSYLIRIDYNELIDKVENEESFVLLLSQTTCSHCMAYKPKLENVANKYKLEVYYIEVNLLDEEQVSTLKGYFNYDGTPTTIFVFNGYEKTSANRINGDTSEEKIIKKLKSNGFID